MNLVRLLVSAVLSMGTGCSPLAYRLAESDEKIVGWRLVNRNAVQNSELVFEPIYVGDGSIGDPSAIVRLDVIASGEAHAGEVLTARISIPGADVDDWTLVKLQTTNEWTRVDGSDRLLLRGHEVRTVRFTSPIVGKVGIRIIAQRLNPIE